MKRRNLFKALIATPLAVAFGVKVKAENPKVKHCEDFPTVKFEYAKPLDFNSIQSDISDYELVYNEDLPGWTWTVRRKGFWKLQQPSQYSKGDYESEWIKRVGDINFTCESID